LTERIVNQHQCFMTRGEMLSAVAVHARLIAGALDHHLTTDLSSLDIVQLEETAFRILQLVQAVKNAAIAEAQLADAQNQEAASAGVNLGGKLQMACELTVGHPDGTTS
jgi:hypothetical protein